MVRVLKQLSKRKVDSFLKRHSEWKPNTAYTTLSRSIPISHYIDGLIIIARMTVHVQLLKHHPDVHFLENKVTIKLTTKELKGITSLDTVLIERIDKIIDSK